MTPRKPDYGIDAPVVRRGMMVAGVCGALVATLSTIVAASTVGLGSAAARSAAVLAVLVACYGFGMAASMTWSSRVGKLRAREQLLDLAGRLRPWTGAEQVLDVGCGRGLMLIGAAIRLTSGRAVGIDIWREEDQSGNNRDATFDNARRAGVLQRVLIETGDARALPFADASFDVVLSHWLVHNIPDQTGRATALDEMVRVLRPGGVLVLADIAHHAAYRARLASHGLAATVAQSGAMPVIMGLLSGGAFQPRSIVALRSPSTGPSGL